MTAHFRRYEPVAVFCGLISAAAVPAVFLAMQSSPGREFEVSVVAVWFAILYPYSFVFVVLLGLPAFFLLRPFRPGHWWSVMSAGGLLGAAAEWLVRIQGRLYVPELLTFGGLGSASALVFWLIWIGSLPKVESGQSVHS